LILKNGYADQMDITGALIKLQRERKIFHSEADFQFDIA